MSKPFEEKGVWVFGAHPNHEFQGDLHWGPTSGATLVVRVLDLEVYTYFAKSLGCDCSVHGRLQTRPCVSLADAKVAKISGNPWDAEVEIHARRLLKGPSSVECWDGVSVTDLSVEFTGLNEWVNNTTIKVKGDVHVLRLESERRVESLFYEDEDLRVFISQSHRSSHSRFSFSVDSVAKFEIRPKKPMTFKLVKQFMDEIRAYLTFATDAPVVAEAVSLILSDQSEPPNAAGIPSIYDYFEQTDRTTFESSRKNYLEHRMLFELTPEPDSALAFSKFLELYKKYPAILDFYFAQTYGSESYLYQQFCDMTFGLEGLHRALHGGCYMDKRDYKLKVLCLIRHCIPGWIPGELKSSIGNRIDSANNYSLRDRLLSLAERHKAYVGPYLGDAELFAKTVTGMRNDIAHAKRGLPKDAAGQHKILALLYRVRLLFQLELLVQLGFSLQYIANRVPFLRSAHVCSRYQILAQ